MRSVGHDAVNDLITTPKILDETLNLGKMAHETSGSDGKQGSYTQMLWMGVMRKAAYLPG